MKNDKNVLMELSLAIFSVYLSQSYYWRMMVEFVRSRRIGLLVDDEAHLVTSWEGLPCGLLVPWGLS